MSVAFAVIVSVCGLVASGCSTHKDFQNAATNQDNGQEVSPINGASGGPRTLPPDSTTSTTATASSPATPPTPEQLQASLLGVTDVAPDARAYDSWAAHLTGMPACLRPVLAASGNAGQATVAYRVTGASTATYPAGTGSGGANPLAVVEYLSSYPGKGAEAAYTSDTAALTSCRSIVLDAAGTALAATGITPSTGPALGSPSRVFEASVRYGTTPLRAEMVVGVDGQVLVMVAYLTPGAPDNATLSRYATEATDDLRLHSRS